MTHADKTRLGDEIAELAAHLDAATHRLLVLIAEFDASGGWADQGALTCAHGRRRRTIPTLLRRALRLRDRGCRFPGCTNRHVDGHHVVPWSEGGATWLRNLVSLCRRHHTYVHEYGVRIVSGDADGALRFVDRDGAPMPACDLRVRTAASFEPPSDVTIDAMTSYPSVDWRSPDYGHVVSTLIPPVPLG